ncbi:hypothetical protein N7536_005973 [Penicillium majusculum]|nr:hypothetical protein N7536_005973 [Penicillium majusculum]
MDGKESTSGIRTKLFLAFNPNHELAAERPFQSTDASGVNNLEKNKKSHGYTVQKAHGLLWHGGKLGVFGEYYFHKYDVVGRGENIELKRGGKPIPLPKVKCKY